MATTPDLTPYNDLVLYDAQPADLVARALLDAATKLPDWEPVDGNTEMVLMEALSLVVAELVYAINRVPSAVTTTLLNLFGITQSPGAPAAATVTFTLSDNLGHDVPAGTLVRLTIGTDTLDFATTAAISVAVGVTTGTAPAVATTNTAIANGVHAGTALELVSSVPFIDTVALGSDVTAGADAEDDTEWLSRAVQQFARLNQTLIRPADFTAETLSTFPQVYRATTIDNFDGAATAAGHVTVAVRGSNGAAISGADKTAIQSDLSGKALANLGVHVIDPTVTTVPVTATVMALPGWLAADVQANVVAALNAYLNTDTWSWSATVRRNELITVMSNAGGVDYVVAFTAPAADVSLTGAAPLAAAGTLAITVNTP